MYAHQRLNFTQYSQYLSNFKLCILSIPTISFGIFCKDAQSIQIFRRKFFFSSFKRDNKIWNVKEKWTQNKPGIKSLIALSWQKVFYPFLPPLYSLQCPVKPLIVDRSSPCPVHSAYCLVRLAHYCRIASDLAVTLVPRDSLYKRRSRWRHFYINEYKIISSQLQGRMTKNLFDYSGSQ